LPDTVDLGVFPENLRIRSKQELYEAAREHLAERGKFRHGPKALLPTGDDAKEIRKKEDALFKFENATSLAVEIRRNPVTRFFLSTGVNVGPLLVYLRRGDPVAASLLTHPHDDAHEEFMTYLLLHKCFVERAMRKRARGTPLALVRVRNVLNA